MNILILEDSVERQKLFTKKFGEHILVMVDSAKSAIEELQSQKWDTVMLDHDLGGEYGVDSGPGTGYEVAKWLSENPQHKPHQIIIHSANPVGRDRMKAELPEAIIAPFIWI
jgi:CheY-like chemotaxis protein